MTKVQAELTRRAADDCVIRTADSLSIDADMLIGSKGEKMIEMLNCDCMEYMATLPDKAFELAIVDPPYGINADLNQLKLANKKGFTKGAGTYKEYHKTNWDAETPDDSFFIELMRVSKNQIVWGGNYFHNLHLTGVIVWNKKGSGNFKEGELAKTSLNTFKVFDYSRADAYINDCDMKIHPTQKPVALYKWLLSRYAKPGDRILDTHGGSGSICIACNDLGFDLTWMELDKDYYEAACKRYKDHAAQAFLFEPQEITRKTYNNEFDLTS